MLKQFGKTQIKITRPNFDLLKTVDEIRIQLICIERAVVLCYSCQGKGNDGKLTFSINVDFNELKGFAKNSDVIELVCGNRLVSLESERIIMFPTFVIPTSETPQGSFYYLV